MAGKEIKRHSAKIDRIRWFCFVAAIFIYGFGKLSDNQA